MTSKMKVLATGELLPTELQRFRGEFNELTISTHFVVNAGKVADGDDMVHIEIKSKGMLADGTARRMLENSLENGILCRLCWSKLIRMVPE